MAKGFVISATRSGEGKTLITLGILHLLSKKGFKVQPFKIGPDYIDPKWHALACGRPSYNLDLFSMGEKRLKGLFYHKSKGCDYSVVEGVMGLFDGKYSTFKVARLVKLPIILILDTYGLAESLTFVVKGFAEKIKRASLPFFLFLNRVSSEKHLLRLEKALKRYPVIGYLFRNKEYELPSRHLGLFLPEHFKEAEALISEVAGALEISFDLSLLQTFENPSFEGYPLPSFLPPLPFKKVGLAKDLAFNFYYQHLLDELSTKSELLFFSPLRDKGLPSQVEALYFGGGYPELFAQELYENQTFIKELKAFVEEGNPLYAECGGLIYLSKGIYWNKRFYPLSGVFPYEIEKKGLTLGYRRVSILETHPFLGDIKGFYAHEFHYSHLKAPLKTSKIKKIFKVSTYEKERFLEGYRYKNALATYLHFLATEEKNPSRRSQL